MDNKCRCSPGITASCHSHAIDDHRICEGTKEDGSKCRGYAQPCSLLCQGHIKLMKKEGKMNSTSKRVFIVWGPGGFSNPSRRYDSSVEATKEAERLARNHVGKEFYVMRAESVSRVEPGITKYFAAEEELPF